MRGNGHPGGGHSGGRFGLTVSANPTHAALALDTLRFASESLGLNTVLGLSNISFGLPARAFLNSAFLAMAAAAGLSCVIANPADHLLRDLRLSADVLTGRDPGAMIFIERLGQAAGVGPVGRGRQPFSRRARTQGRGEGQQGKDRGIFAGGLAAGPSASGPVNPCHVSGHSGSREPYARREYFLPQLIAAAEAMEAGVRHLTPLLQQEQSAPQGTVVMATVKGDVHDIGKKIVCLMLRNRGYRVIDLGKSVDGETIVRRGAHGQGRRDRPLGADDHHHGGNARRDHNSRASAVPASSSWSGARWSRARMPRKSAPTGMRRTRSRP